MSSTPENERPQDEASRPVPNGDLDLYREPAETEGARQGSPPPPGFRPERRPLTLLAVHGAKGGVGKTTLATNLGVYLASVGRETVVVDCDAAGANAHTLLGLPPYATLLPYLPPLSTMGSAGAPPEPEPASRGISLRQTDVHGLHLAHLGADALFERKRRLSCTRLLERLRALHAEYVVLDLGAEPVSSLVETWLQSDAALYVVTPEPAAIENTYRFVRLCFAHAALRGLRDEAERKQLAVHLNALGGSPSPLDLARRLEAERDPLAHHVRATLESFRFHFVVNQCRTRADLELGERMRSAARRRLGVRMRYLGYVDHDDTVWSCARARTPVLLENPGARASRSIEKVARRLLALTLEGTLPEPEQRVPPETHHDLLEVERGASPEEVRRAYQRALDLYAPDSPSCYGLFDEAGLEALRSRIDEAHAVLMDPVRRRAYELSVFPPQPLPEPEPPPSSGTSEVPPPDITPETEFSGPLLRAVRESRGIPIEEIARRTKVRVHYLRAIEEEHFEALPAPVYVRGFVAQAARVLGIDPARSARTYVRRYERFLAERGSENP